MEAEFYASWEKKSSDSDLCGLGNQNHGFGSSPTYLKSASTVVGSPRAEMAYTMAVALQQFIGCWNSTSTSRSRSESWMRGCVYMGVFGRGGLFVGLLMCVGTRGLARVCA